MMAPAPASPPPRRIELLIPEEARGRRLDRVLADLMPDQSRASLQRLVNEGRILIAGNPVRASRRIRGGEVVVIVLPEPVPSVLEAEDRPLRILHEDDDLIVLNKPAGLVVHPGAGVRSGTLANALLHHFRGLSSIGGVERPGIVHRLDRETSGVIVVAKNDMAHRSLSAQFKDRTMKKIYEALVWGRPRRQEGSIDEPIGRHPTARIRMAVRASGRPSRSDYRVVTPFGAVSLLELRPRTGRTHQLRVHMSHLGHPILGDRLYGGHKPRSVRNATERDALSGFDGLALHARRLGLIHPRTSTDMEFEAPRPEALEQLIEILKGARERSSTGKGDSK